MRSFIPIVVGCLFASLYVYILVRRHHNEPGAAIDLFFLRDRMTPAFSWVLAFLACLHVVLFQTLYHPIVHAAALFLGAVYVSYFSYVTLLQRYYLLDKLFILGITLCVGSLLLPNSIGIPIYVLGLTLLAFAYQYKEVLYAERYRRWTERKAKYLHKKYGHHFKKLDSSLKAIVLSIMVVEDVARPRIIRGLEWVYAKYHPKMVVTTGLMQVGSRGPLSDEQSVYKGIKIIKKQYRTSKKFTDDGRQLAYDIAVNYNGNPTYLKLISYFYDECSKVIQNDQS